MLRMNHPLFEAVDEGWSRAEPPHVCPSGVLGTYVSDTANATPKCHTQINEETPSSQQQL